MRLQEASSSGPAASSEALQAKKLPTNVFLDRTPSLASFSGPTYVTAQSLIQQVAYVLSDKIFSYSPDTFDLDYAARAWSESKETNANGYATTIYLNEIRNGAGSLALGYLFSKDFDVKKRHIPQAVIASTAAIQSLKPALDQLSLLYAVSNPFVAHVSAVDYDASKQGGLVTDYSSILDIAEDLGFGLLCSQSAYEVQHMSLLATLLAQDLPMMHVYDGTKVGRDTTRVIDVLDRSGLHTAYSSALNSSSDEERKHLSIEGKALRTFKSLNEELGTDYRPFEYHGHESAETVLVCFGSIEASLASQTVSALAKADVKIGVINVRLYRPFIEEQFLKVVPESAKLVAVLGQVVDTQAVQESGMHSKLYEDVLAALAYSSVTHVPEIREIKYPRSEKWSPASFSSIFQMLCGKKLDDKTFDSFLDSSVQQYSFWNTDDSPSAGIASHLAQALAKDSAQNVTLSTTYDNLVQGGAHRIDVRKSPKSLNAAYPITSADTAVIIDLKLLNQINILQSIKPGGKVILVLPGVKDEDIEKKLSSWVKKSFVENGLELYLVDSTRTELDIENVESLIVQASFLRIALGKMEDVGIQKLSSSLGGDKETLDKVATDLEKTLRQVEIPKEWDLMVDEKEKGQHSLNLSSNSFTPYEKLEDEPPSLLRDWEKAAKGLLFREAYKTKSKLRPDLPTKTYTVHVKENRRLTPLTYDRNIFHIEFDLGSSGLKYNIGEALGIHAENDHTQVMEFIKWYGLDPEEVVEVASREDPSIFGNRTTYQSLMQNIDIFGRPPKKFYEILAESASDENEKKNLLTLAGPEGYKEFQRRAEVDTITYADVLLEFSSAHPSFHEIVRMVAPMKRREYSIASCQAVTPTSVALMVVVVNWVDPRGRDRFGQATKYLSDLKIGAPLTVSVKPSVMKLPPKSTQPLIMAGLGTGLAPFRAFVQHRAMEKAQGKDIGSVLLYMGSRHQREEYCYGEEWEAYQAAGVITLLGRAFSRDQPQKIYIQDRMRQTMDDIINAYIKEDGCFYLCGPTWPVPDVTNVLEEAISREAKTKGAKKIDASREIMRLKDEGRYVLEVY